MELIKRLSLILLLLCTTSSLWSNGGLQFKGKLRILRPTTLQVKDLNGNLVLTCSISQNGVFETEKKEIQPDVYTLCIGKTEQNIYFENTSVSINGFFDEKNPEQSSLSFTGIDPFLTLQNYFKSTRITSHFGDIHRKSLMTCSIDFIATIQAIGQFDC